MPCPYPAEAFAEPRACLDSILKGDYPPELLEIIVVEPMRIVGLAWPQGHRKPR